MAKLALARNSRSGRATTQIQLQKFCPQCSARHGGFSMAISRHINCRSEFSMTHWNRFHHAWMFALGLVLSTLCVNPPSHAQEGRRLRAGYTSLSGNMLPLWAAREGGYFKKHGLEFDLISMPSGNEGMSALIAGELEFLAIAGSTTASAATGGARGGSFAHTFESGGGVV